MTHPSATTAHHSALNTAQRTRDLTALREGAPLDLIVIGGGITGVGVALDAVTRGLTTALLERRDIGHGTSRFSSKLAHGGLRYLTKGEIGIAHHSAVERGILMEHTAPHLVKALPQLTALGPDTNLIQKAAMRAGFIAGDLLRITAGTKATTLPRSRFATAQETKKLCPEVTPQGLLGSWINYDGQMVDDARVALAVARTAASHGAHILTRINVTEANGTTITATDDLTGDHLTLTARAVVSATGVWAGELASDISVRPSRGTHLIVHAKRLGNPTGALTVPLPGSISRYLFILPAPLGRCYIGLTDEEQPGPIPDVPPTPEEDINFLLENINRILKNPLTHDDIIGAFTGLRPLLESGDHTSTADMSRRHAVLTAPNGLISVVGGKFTEYRLMAEDTVNHIITERHLAAGPCVTQHTPLIGSPTHPHYAVNADRLDDLPDGLIHRFGNEAPNVIDAATIERPRDTITGTDILRAEIEYAVTHEGALSVDDVLDRRTRIGLVEDDRATTYHEVATIVETALANTHSITPHDHANATNTGTTTHENHATHHTTVKNKKGNNRTNHQGEER
ncbi:glycerol-3-phosphate dehydrogenase/oxidase [Corynebacterium kroppenstedtii]|uniref:glycerol-3-phosphate dehydrogenase/oxidase n=1 Tax=Corynebacterium sp. PCR 32 TaxID=3351342 RepID=UPI0030B30FCE